MGKLNVTRHPECVVYASEIRMRYLLCIVYTECDCPIVRISILFSALLIHWYRTSHTYAHFRFAFHTLYCYYLWFSDIKITLINVCINPENSAWNGIVSLLRYFLDFFLFCFSEIPIVLRCAVLSRHAVAMCPAAPLVENKNIICFSRIHIIHGDFQWFIGKMCTNRYRCAIAVIRHGYLNAINAIVFKCVCEYLCVSVCISGRRFGTCIIIIIVVIRFVCVDCRLIHAWVRSRWLSSLCAIWSKGAFDRVQFWCDIV